MNPMIDWRADLHCHTTASDGSDSPEKIIELALQAGLQGLSITDHDTIYAYDFAKKVADQANFPLLPGLELSTVFRGESIHILVYSFALQNEIIHDLILSQKKRRYERNRKILSKLKGLGIEIHEEELGLSEATGRPHIAAALIEKGVVGSMKEAFEKYLGEGKLAYDGGERMEVPQAIDLIHKAGAKAVIAHPHLIKKRKILAALYDMPFDGIECYYAFFQKEREAPFLRVARKKGWIVTGGSDYHGLAKAHISLGSSWVGKESFYVLYEHYLRNEARS